MEEMIYEVGAKRQWTSLSALLLELKGDTREKIIRLDPEVFDIYREYRALGMETPPDDITAGDYLERCVFLPPNTKLVGAGPGTVLLWNPGIEEITKGEARTWSPLNVRYRSEVENLTIECHNGRYCIHDDSHNAPDDRGVAHIYRNVHCIYRYSEDGKGFNNTIGFGFSQKNRYLFENCTFEMLDCPEDSPNHSAFYGHAASGRELVPEDGPEILIKNCRMKGGPDNQRSVRFQCLNRCPLHATALLKDCEIEGGLYLTLYHEDAVQAFEVTLVNSGNPALMIDKEERNTYPVRFAGGKEN